MAEFDRLQSHYSPELVRTLGDKDAFILLTKAGKRPFPAIVGNLRRDRFDLVGNAITTTEHEEWCQAQIACKRSEIWIDARGIVPKFTDGDASTHEGQEFTVRQIISEGGGFVTVQLVRDFIADIQRTGYEGASR